MEKEEKISITKFGDLVEMPLEEFKALVAKNDLGYAMGCKNVFTLCFDNVSKRVSALREKSVEYKKRDTVMSNMYSDYAKRLMYSQLMLEDKVVFLKKYIEENKVVLN